MVKEKRENQIPVLLSDQELDNLDKIVEKFAGNRSQVIRFLIQEESNILNGGSRTRI